MRKYLTGMVKLDSFVFTSVSSVNLVPVGEKGAKDCFKLHVLFASLTVKQK